MKPPAFQFYADDFLAGVADMTQAEVGAYILLLCHQWSRGEIPADAERAGLVAKGPVTPHVIAKFPTGRNPRLEAERAKQDEWREKQRAKGVASGKARTNHGSTTVQPRFNHGSTTPPTEPQPEGNSPLSTLHSPTPKEEEEHSSPVAPSPKKPDGYHTDSLTVLHILNESTGRHYRETDGNLGVISARLKEPDVDLAGVRKMIARQCALWNGGDMAEYLRPETLFGKQKFDSYYAGRDASIPTNQPHANSRPNPAKPHRNDFIAGAGAGPSTTEILRRRAEREASERLSAAGGPVASQVAQVAGD